MKRLAITLLAVTGLSVGLGQMVSAADLPAKAPLYKVPAEVVVYSWSGFYVGGHVGGGWGDWSSRADPLPSNAVFGTTSGIFSQRDSGAVAGGQVGYNWQATRNWVLGVEGDLSWTGISQNSSTAILPLVGILGCAACSSTTGRDVNWLATVRGRVGYAWDRVLFYATGGVAFSDLSYRGGFVTAAAVGAPPVYTAPVAFSSTKTGWVVGGGLEYGLASNWTIRGEYLFYHFDGDSANGSDPRFPAPIGTAYTWSDTKLHVARVGLNYKFNQGPVVAKY